MNNLHVDKGIKQGLFLNKIDLLALQGVQRKPFHCSIVTFAHSNYITGYSLNPFMQMISVDENIVIAVYIWWLYGRIQGYESHSTVTFILWRGIAFYSAATPSSHHSLLSFDCWTEAEDHFFLNSILNLIFLLELSNS